MEKATEKMRELTTEEAQAAVDEVFAAAGLPQEEIDETIRKKYGHKDPHKMTREQYDESCAALDKLAASQTEGGQENA